MILLACIYKWILQKIMIFPYLISRLEIKILYILRKEPQLHNNCYVFLTINVRKGNI